VTRHDGKELPSPPDSVAGRIRNPHGSVPGGRDGLPAGTLRERPPEPQGDENREPPRPPMPPP